MKAQERVEFIQHFLDKFVHPVMRSKGGEYSRGEEDVNSNFKRVAEGLDLTPEQVCYTYLAKHMDSIANAVKTGKFEGLSEDINSRIGDAVNYLIILGSLIRERLGNPPTGDLDLYPRGPVPLTLGHGLPFERTNYAEWERHHYNQRPHRHRPDGKGTFYEGQPIT